MVKVHVAVTKIENGRNTGNCYSGEIIEYMQGHDEDGLPTPVAVIKRDGGQIMLQQLQITDGDVSVRVLSEGMKSNSESEHLVDLPRYKCHKVVSAAKIKRITKLGSEVIPEMVSFELSVPLPRIVVDIEWFLKHKPEVGGYYVVYEDRYASYSPAKQFEEGYTLIDEQAQE